MHPTSARTTFATPDTGSDPDQVENALAHVSGDEIAAPGPVNKTVIVDDQNVTRTPRRLPERIQSQLSQNKNAAYLPELFVSYRHPNDSHIAPAAFRSAMKWNDFTRSDLSRISKSIPPEREHLAIIILAHNSRSGSDSSSPTGATRNNRNPIFHDQENHASLLQPTIVRESLFADLSLQTYSTMPTSTALNSTTVAVTKHVSTDFKPRLLGRELHPKESQPKGMVCRIGNINLDCGSYLLQ